MSHLHSICLSSSPFPSKTINLNHYHHHHHHHQKLPFSSYNPTQFRKANSSTKHAINSAAASSENVKPGTIQERDALSKPLVSASDVVRNFYDGINRHDLASVEPLIAPNCVYEDLIFPQPFVGRKSILEFFGKFIDSVSTDLLFVIDAISEEDTTAVGVTWHLEWKGKAFPFSKGCSFYQLEEVNGVRHIIYARDSVEPAIKPGESALIAIRGVTWLLQRFPNLADRL